MDRSSLSSSSLACLALVLLVCSSALVEAQIPIPRRPDGFVFQGDAGAPVQLEVFVDLLCPYSARTLPTLKQVAARYGEQNLRLNVHIFPLVFHRNGFLAAKAANVVANVNNGKQFWPFVDAVFNNIGSFTEAATMNQTETQIVANMAKLASQIGVSQDEFTNGMNNYDNEDAAKLSWKYGCSRGVVGTPSFLVNGVTVMGQSTWTVDDWATIINPLLKPFLIRDPLLLASDDCPAGQEKCVYLPGQFECCLAGEACIPNVGCRC